MNLSEIILINKDHTKSIEYGQIHPYKKLLYTYYKDLFCCEPVLMVTEVFNAAQYAKIVPIDELNDAIEAYHGKYDQDDFETVLFNSKLLKDIL